MPDDLRVLLICTGTGAGLALVLYIAMLAVAGRDHGHR